ncbi:MAG: hypothetical protein H0V73_04905 [Chloroflexi bacterium]|nr:hypothetical protein [Chloroflexota bacterium]
MTRRLAFLPIALVAVLSLVFAACSPTPAAAPALTDPKEIVTKGVTSLVDVKSFEFTGTFTGNVTAAQMGNFDLSTIKLAGAVDVANKTAKFNLDAPSLLGSKLDAIVVGDAAYYKVSGALAAGLKGSADKYTKVPVPTASGDPAAAATDITKLVAQLQTSLAMLPSPLTKGTDEKCGDADCYHVTTTVTGAQLQALGAGSTADGDLKFDLWTLKSNYRPAKIGLSMTSASLGTFGFALDIKYDVSVSISAPPADQVLP